MTGLGKRGDYTAVRMQYIRFFYRLKKIFFERKIDSNADSNVTSG